MRLGKCHLPGAPGGHFLSLQWAWWAIGAVKPAVSPGGAEASVLLPECSQEQRGSRMATWWGTLGPAWCPRPGGWAATDLLGPQLRSSCCNHTFACCVSQQVQSVGNQSWGHFVCPWNPLRPHSCTLLRAGVSPFREGSADQWVNAVQAWRLMEHLLCPSFTAPETNPE